MLYEKISDFIPNKVIKKKQYIDKLDEILSAEVEDNMENYCMLSITQIIVLLLNALAIL